MPGLAGGPWHWDRWAPASPWATPPPPVMVLGWLVLIAVLALSLIRKQRIGPVWLTAAGYAVACQVPIYLMRSSKLTALELAQTLRYLPDLVVVLALLAAVALCAPEPVVGARWLDASPRRTVVTTGLAVLFVASSLYSTATFLTSWRDNPAQPYLQNARASLAAAHAEFDCSVAGPGGRSAGAATGGLRRRTWPATCSPCCAIDPNSTTATTQLRMLDSSGRLIAARVTWVRTIVPGPDAAVRLFRPAGQAGAH